MTASKNLARIAAAAAIAGIAVGVRVSTSPSVKGIEPSTPIRAAFYYPWYPETWYPGIHFTPTLGAPYNSSDPAVIQYEIASMEYANITVGIASWWARDRPPTVGFQPS